VTQYSVELTLSAPRKENRKKKKFKEWRDAGKAPDEIPVSAHRELLKIKPVIIKFQC
jgi:hypothetical protein